MFGASKADVFVLVVIFVIVVFYFKNRNAEVTYVTAQADGRSYLCLRLPDRQEAAEKLAALNESMIALVRHMAASAPDDEAVARLYANYDPDAIHEGSWTTGYTSFSVNKGESITLCIRQKDWSFVEHNTVMYVAIHELAHLMTQTIGHEPDFWANFVRLLDQAMLVGLYTKVDFAADPEPYCGITITSSVV